MGAPRARCGQRYSLGSRTVQESLLSEQSESLERALWAAVRALEESAALSHRLGASGQSELRHRFREKASTQAEQAELIRQILLHGAMLSGGDAAAL